MSNTIFCPDCGQLKSECKCNDSHQITSLMFLMDLARMSQIKEAYNPSVVSLFDDDITDDEVKRIDDIFLNFEEIGDYMLEDFFKDFKIINHNEVLENSWKEMDYPNNWWDNEYFDRDYDLQCEEIREQSDILVYNIVDEMDLIKRC